MIVQENNTTIVYDVSDLDGMLSKIIAERAFNDELQQSVGWASYWKDDKAKWEQLAQHCMGTRVIMVDCSVTAAQFRTLVKNCIGVTVIDHHQSLADDIKEYPDMYGGVQYIINMNKAACEIAWEFFFGGERQPMLVDIIGSYDIWRKDGNWKWDFVKAINVALEVAWDEDLLKLYLDDERFSRDMERLEDDGNSMLSYERSFHQKLYKSGIVGEWCDHKVIAINGKVKAPGRLWELCEREDTSLDLLVLYHRLPSGDWVHSMRSSHVSVKDIAVAHGGGGHTLAASFVANNYIRL